MFLLGGIGFGLGLSQNGSFGAQSANQSRMALANGVTGNESPAQILALQQADKTAEMSSAGSSISAGYGEEWDEQARRMQKQNVEQERRLQSLSFNA